MLGTRNLRRFAKATEGVMAVEFALIAPVMIFMLFGMIELTDAVHAKRRVGMSASMLGDLATNRSENWIFETELEDLFDISASVLEPYGIANVDVTITSITWDDAANEPIVVWSKIRGANGEVVDNPDSAYDAGEPFVGIKDQDFQIGTEGLVDASQNIVAVEMDYPFVSTLSNIVFSRFQIGVQELRTPRRAPTLRYCENPGGCTDGVAWNNGKGKPQDET